MYLHNKVADNAKYHQQHSGYPADVKLHYKSLQYVTVDFVQTGNTVADNTVTASNQQS